MRYGAIAVAGLGPSFGPTVVTLFGIETPVAAMGLSMLALVVARQIARPPTRKLTTWQEFSLNVGLVIVLFLVVTGQLFYSQKLGPGWAAVWGFGLGMTGLLIFELMGDWVARFVRTFLRAAGAGQEPPPPPPPSILP